MNARRRIDRAPEVQRARRRVVGNGEERLVRAGEQNPLHLHLDRGGAGGVSGFSKRSSVRGSWRTCLSTVSRCAVASTKLYGMVLSFVLHLASVTTAARRGCR